MRFHTLIGLTTLLMALAAANTVAQSARDPRPRIDRVEPAEPIAGQSFEIHGDHFGDQQGRWVLYLYRPARNGDTLTYDLSIIDWRNQLIRAKLPDGIPASSELPSGTRYVLHIVVRGRLLQSNHFHLSVAKATRPPVISRAGEPWIRAIYRDGLRELLWIYGEFPPIPYTGGTRGIPNGIELLIKRPGESTRMPMHIVQWEPKRMVADTGVGCGSSGTHLVEFRTGTTPVHRSNEAPVMLDNIWCLRTTEGMERRFMHIDGVEIEATPHDGTQPPQYPRPGDWLDIFGTGFGDLWESELRISEGKRVVELFRGVHGRAQIIEAPVLNLIRGVDPDPPNYRRGQHIETRLQWSDFHILVEIPRDLVPDEYMVSIYDKLSKRRSNNVMIRIVARQGTR